MAKKKSSSGHATSPTIKARREGKSATLLSIEAQFDVLCAQPTVVHLCQTCDSEMVNVKILFFLADKERSWNVPLPICPKCYREEYIKFTSRPAP